MKPEDIYSSEEFPAPPQTDAERQALPIRLRATYSVWARDGGGVMAPIRLPILLQAADMIEELREQQAKAGR